MRALKSVACAAVAVFLALIGLAAAMVFLLNPLTVALSPIALLLAVLYPLAKRVLPIPQAILGIAFGWGAIMAWSAVRDEIGWPAIGLLIATIFWAIGYDTISPCKTWTMINGSTCIPPPFSSGYGHGWRSAARCPRWWRCWAWSAWRRASPGRST